MKWFILILFTVCSFAQTAPKKRELAPPKLGQHYAKGRAPNFKHRSPNMTWHQGAIMPSSTSQAIFWGNSWNNSSFVADKITGLDSFYGGWGNSNYAKTSDEYTGSNGQVGPSNAYAGHLVDTSPASGGENTAAILDEVCKAVVSPVAGSYYPVYTDVPRGSAGYCAYHSYGSCGSVNIQFAYFWNLDGDAGCDPQSTVSGESQGLAALANVSGHEFAEEITDPRNAGWWDSNGQENGDKCSWSFNVPSVSFSNGTLWKIQGEWSNAAYTAGTGYPNRSGLKGCLDGH